MVRDFVAILKNWGIMTTTILICPEWLRLIQETICTQYNKLSMIVTARDEDESDDDFSPKKDLFSMHFGKLSTALKFETNTTSTRSSFSTHFF